MQKHMNFILLSRSTNIVSKIFGLKLWGTLPPKNLFDQVDKVKFFICYCEKIVRVGLIVEDSVIICELIKCVTGTTLFGCDFYPLKTI